MTTFSTQVVIFDPKTVGGSGDPGVLVMKRGDHLIVAAGQPAPRLTIAGGMVDALQVTYWYEGSQSPERVPVLDEWIDMKSGRLVQLAYRNERALPDGILHNIRFSRFDWTPSMFSGFLWDRNLTDAGGRITPSPEQVGPQSHQVARLGPLEYTIKAGLVDGRCQATFRAASNFLDPSYPDKKYTVTFNGEHALPIDFLSSSPDGNSDARTHLVLDSEVVGRGASAPRFQPLQSVPATHLRLEVPENGFLVGTATDLPTSYDAAVQAARSDFTSWQWFNQHPDAQPVHVKHALGEPSTSIIDEWIIEWATPNGDGLQTIVDRIRPLLPLPLPGDEFEVYGSPQSGLSLPEVGPRIRLDDMQALSRSVYGDKLETVECYFERNQCDFGTHNGTGMPRAGLGSGAVYWLGLLVDVKRGLILQESDYSEAALGPPVTAS